METMELVASLGVALGVGLMIGLQREQSAHEEGRDQQSFLGGIRTYPLFAMTGSIAALLAPHFGVWLLATVFISLVLMLSLAYHEDVRQGRDRGLSTAG